MVYLVSITPRAERDFASLYDEINATESVVARAWYAGFKEAILSLKEHPNRCPVTPEKKALRHLLYGNKPNIYRVIFRVVEKERRVEVLHIRHGARRGLRAKSSL